jgi:hypothetical protein
MQSSSSMASPAAAASVSTRKVWFVVKPLGEEGKKDWKTE